MVINSSERCLVPRPSPAVWAERRPGSADLGSSTRFRWRAVSFMPVLFTIFAVAGTLPPSLVLSCTTAVISGRVTADGRPILWKNRDYASAPRNEVVRFVDGRYTVIAVVNAGQRTSVWMGCNSAGLCIENSLSLDLKDDDSASGLGNGQFMKRVLQTCATVADVANLLEETNKSGRKTTANFGVIDAQGGAAIFEASLRSYRMFDANDPEVAPNGYLVRSNFATSAHDLEPAPAADAVADIPSGVRYARACQLISASRSGADSADLSAQGQGIEFERVLTQIPRDLGQSDIFHDLSSSFGSLPESISTEQTISRHTTVSAVVFQGVRPSEDPRLTTMWTFLGDPKFSIAVPCWAAQTEVAEVLQGQHGGEIGEIARTLRDASLMVGADAIHTSLLPGIWSDTLPLEQAMISQTHQRLEDWRENGWDEIEVNRHHSEWASRAHAAMLVELQQAKTTFLERPTGTWQVTPRVGVIHVAIYDHSNGTANGPKHLLKFLTEQNGFRATRITPAEIREGKLDQYDVLIMPGGSGSGQAEKLQVAGRDAIKEFVRQGGGYVGICAGAYLATSHYSWSLGIANARVWDRAHWARGNGSVSIKHSEGDRSADDAADHQIHYAQGPLLVPGNLAGLPPYEVVATYRSEVVEKGAIPGAMCDTHAMVRTVFGSGKVYCISPHPERPGGPNRWIVDAVRWVAGEVMPAETAKSPADEN